MIERSEVVALMTEPSMKAVPNNDNTGFSVLCHDTIMADVDQVPVPPAIVWSGLEEDSVDCYDIYYIPQTKRAQKGMKRSRLVLELDMTAKEVARALKKIFSDQGSSANLDKKKTVVGIIGEVKEELGEDHFPDYDSTAAYYVSRGKEDIYYIWIGYDTYDQDNLNGRTRNNLIIECSTEGYKYRFSRELFSDKDDSLSLELTKWELTDLDDLREEIEQYIYICKYNAVE